MDLEVPSCANFGPKLLPNLAALETHSPGCTWLELPGPGWTWLDLGNLDGKSG